MKLEPLTPEEQAYAADHYTVVSRFLSVHRLPEAEWFDVVVFGYLEAVQKHFRKPCPPEKQGFISLAWLCMNSCLCQDWIMRNRIKRRPDYYSISLDRPIELDNQNQLSLYEILPDPGCNVAKQVENEDVIYQAFHLANEKERMVFSLKQSGYSCNEISELLGIPVRTVWNRLRDFRAKASVLNEYAPPKETRKEYARRYYEAHRKEHEQHDAPSNPIEKKRGKRKARQKMTTEERQEKQRQRCRAYWAAHKEEINARRNQKNREARQKKTAPDGVSIGSGQTRTGL